MIPYGYVKLSKKVITDCNAKYEHVLGQNLKYDTIKCEISCAIIKFSKQKARIVTNMNRNYTKKKKQTKKQKNKKKNKQKTKKQTKMS